MKRMTWMSILPLLTALSYLPAKADTNEANDEVLVNYLRESFDLSFSEYEIEVLSNRLNEVDLANVEFAVNPLTKREPLGLYTVAVTTTAADGKSRSGQVRFDIRRFAEVLVLTDKVRRSHLIGENQVELERIEITNLREQALLSSSELQGKRAARNLRKGSILTTNSIENIPDIESGNEISIVFSSGNCRISAVGVALQNGESGEMIKVKNRESGKILMARVVDSKAVAVDL